MELGIIIGLALFFIALIVGIPIGWALLVSALAGIILTGGPLLWIAGTAWSSMDSYILMAIAFFIFAGNLMAAAGMAERLVNFSYALVGKVKGGLIDAGIVAVLFLSALTGSAWPTIAATIPLLVSPLDKYGHDRVYTTAVLCSSSFLGYLIPPSVPVLIYCLVAQQSVAAVFLSTIFPGLILAGGYMVLNHFIVSRYMHPATEVPELPVGLKGYLKGINRTFWLALPALGCPVVILGGIYGGICTPNEAGSVAVIYAIIIGFFVYRKMTPKSFLRVSKDTVVIMGFVTVMLAFSCVFTKLLILEGVAQAFAEFMIGTFQSKYLILFMMNILLLIAGMLIDTIPILLIVVPLIMPLIQGIGLNLVHLGAIVVVNVGIGCVTPPMAGSIFLASRLTGISFEELLKPMMIFLFVVELPVLLLTTYLPVLSCWLPSLIVGQNIVGPW